MKIKEIKILNALSRSKLPDCDYVINPYVGCAHGCAYCYARFMKFFSGHKENWGEFLDVKANIGWALENQLKRSQRSAFFKKGLVFMSSVTDPYQPIEKKYELTKQCLALLARYDWPVSILTKSKLVTRDINLFKRFSNIEVGLSIGVLNDETAHLFEPASSLVKDRKEALEELARNSIKTYLFIAPVLPYLTDLEKIFRTFSKKVGKIYVETLNTKTVNWRGVRKVLGKSFPELLPKYEEIFFTSKKSVYLDKLQKEVNGLGKKYGVETKVYTHE